MGKVICYYHKIDLDGKCSAAIVRRKYPDCELIGVDYPDRPDFEKINSEDTVFVVDFSFEPDDMERLLEICRDLIWVDHHKSSIEKIGYQIGQDGVSSLAMYINGQREIGKAGCELTWQYLFPEEPTPNVVKLLGGYDVFDKSDIGYWENYILPFQYGMRMSDWSPEITAWQNLFGKDPELAEKIFEMRLAKGETILAYEDQQNATYAKEMAFPVEFEGHEAWAINKALGNSKIFETFGSQERPLWILFSYKAGVWKYSLYANPAALNLDVSQIAVKYGGGGHAGAAGFQSNKYLLKEQV
jgi:oligoribonuclease NrnB/cAMP/cGMP phosphodiesterase (DHH superfamily)